MAGLDSATGGRARLGNTEITELPDADLSILGRCRVGFVIQSSTPMPMRDVRRNILLAFELSTDDAPPTPTLRWSAAAGRTPPIALHRMIGSSAADQRRGVCSVLGARCRDRARIQLVILAAVLSLVGRVWSASSHSRRPAVAEIP